MYAHSSHGAFPENGKMDDLSLRKMEQGPHRSSNVKEVKGKGQKEKAPVPERRSSPVWQDLLLLFLKIIIIAAVFVMMCTFVFGIFRYPDRAMAPALKDGDLVIYYRLDKNYAASDAIVLEYEGQLQVRRVVAVAGDTVDINENGLMINGALQQETEIYEETYRYEEGVEFPLTVPEGYVFVLGDSRENSTDSRIYGPVAISDTKGKVMTIIRRRGI